MRADEEAVAAILQILAVAPALHADLVRGAVKSLPELKERMTAHMMTFDPTWEAYPAFMLRVLHFRLGVRTRQALQPKALLSGRAGSRFSIIYLCYGMSRKPNFRRGHAIPYTLRRVRLCLSPSMQSRRPSQAQVPGYGAYMLGYTARFCPSAVFWRLDGYIGQASFITGSAESVRSRRGLLGCDNCADLQSYAAQGCAVTCEGAASGSFVSLKFLKLLLGRWEKMASITG